MKIMLNGFHYVLGIFKHTKLSTVRSYFKVDVYLMFIYYHYIYEVAIKSFTEERNN